MGNYFKPPLDLRPQHNAKLTSSVTAAVELAVAECRHQFRFDAWNCPEVAFGEGGDGGGADYGTGDLRSDLTLTFSNRIDPQRPSTRQIYSPKSRS